MSSDKLAKLVEKMKQKDKGGVPELEDMKEEKAEPKEEPKKEEVKEEEKAEPKEEPKKEEVKEEEKAEPKDKTPEKDVDDEEEMKERAIKTAKEVELLQNDGIFRVELLHRLDKLNDHLYLLNTQINEILPDTKE